jgi:hypothetical protein
MKFVKSLVMISLVVFVFAGCEMLGLTGDDLVDTWRWDAGSSWEEITFKSDNTFSVSGYNSSTGNYSFTGTYSKGDATITFNPDGGSSFTYDYELNGDDLILTYGGTSYTYNRQ